MENPEVEFLQWLLKRFIDMNEIDPGKTLISELLLRIDEELTPIGGG